MVTFTPAAQSLARGRQHLLAPQRRGRQVDQHAGLRRQGIQRQPQLGDGEGVDLTFDAQLP